MSDRSSNRSLNHLPGIRRAAFRALASDAMPPLVYSKPWTPSRRVRPNRRRRARRVRATPVRGPLSVVLLAAFLLTPTRADSGSPEPAAVAYQKGRAAYYDLKEDPERQKYRHHWVKVIRVFEGVWSQHSSASEAPKALYTAANLTHDLYEISRNPEDADRAVELYRTVPEQYPDSSLADDALYQAATLLQRRGRRKEARSALKALLANHRIGDMAPRARRLLSDLLGEGAKGTEGLVRKSRVVLDPGHGGRDRGATGIGGLKEKRVNLEIARRIEKKLEGAGVEVVMTRTDDATVSLDDRAELANSVEADLMVSIHANAAKSSEAHGIETYYLDVTHNRYAKRLADRENDGQTGDAKLILADLATKVSTRESRALATDVQARLMRSIRRVNSTARDLGAKPAMLHVLMGARCPAILVETAFVSNPREATLLGRADYQEAVAEAVSQGILAHLKAPALARVD